MSQQFFNEEKPVIGIDDGYFKHKKKGETIIIGVEHLNKKPVNISAETIEIDGNNATEKAVKLLHNLGVEKSIVFLDGVTYAGFNYIDPLKLRKATDSHIIIVFYKLPRKKLVEKALKKHFSDYKDRWSVIGGVLRGSRRIVTEKGPVDYYSTLDDVKTVYKIIVMHQAYSRIPQPIITAHLIASEMSRFLYKKGFLY